MRRFFAFWWFCIRQAFWGNSFFESEWHWRSAMRCRRCWSRECWQLYAAPQHGSPAQVSSTFPYTALVAFVIAWIAGFLIRLINLPPEYFYRQTERADRLE